MQCRKYREIITEKSSNLVKQHKFTDLSWLNPKLRIHNSPKIRSWVNPKLRIHNNPKIVCTKNQILDSKMVDYKESWAPRIDAFELWCWRRLLRVPWTARRSNQSILKEISPGCSLEGLMLKLKHEFGWALGVGHRGLAYCSSWGHRVGHDWATELSWTEPIPVFLTREFHGQRSLAGYIVHGVAKTQIWLSN